MAFNDFFTNGEAKAAAFDVVLSVQAFEGFKDVGLIIGVDAHAIINDGDDDVAISAAGVDF